MDDHTIVRRSLRLLIERNPDIVVVGEAGDGWEAIEQTKNTSPDIVLLDIRMPNLNGIDACRHIRRDFPDTKVIALSTGQPLIINKIVELTASIGPVNNAHFLMVEDDMNIPYFCNKIQGSLNKDNISCTQSFFLG